MTARTAPDVALDPVTTDPTEPNRPHRSRVELERERLREAGRALGRAAGPLPPDQAARVAAILAAPAKDKPA